MVSRSKKLYGLSFTTDNLVYSVLTNKHISEMHRIIIITIYLKKKRYSVYPNVHEHRSRLLLMFRLGKDMMEMSVKMSVAK